MSTTRETLDPRDMWHKSHAHPPRWMGSPAFTRPWKAWLPSTVPRHDDTLEGRLKSEIGRRAPLGSTHTQESDTQGKHHRYAWSPVRAFSRAIKPAIRASLPRFRCWRQKLLGVTGQLIGQRSWGELFSHAYREGMLSPLLQRAVGRWCEAQAPRKHNDPVQQCPTLLQGSLPGPPLHLVTAQA
jgi:hypothetical protein